MFNPEEIPFLDLVTPHVEMEEELTAAFRHALRTAGFIGGYDVEEFEKEFSRFCGTSHAVAVGSGTDALRFAIMAAGIQPGEVVITVPHTFIATTEAISQAGAIPEFVDIDEITYNMSAERLQEFVDAKCGRDSAGRLISRRHGRRVTAVLPVHIYGQMTDMDAIVQIAEANQLIVLEDACQAHGAEYFSRQAQRWLRAGSVGAAAAFSFYPGKNLGACGEAGAVTTNDPELAAKVKVLRDHGQTCKYFHSTEGYNGRLDAIQAGLLRLKLRHLSKWNDQRRERAAVYNRLLAYHTDIIRPCETPWSRGVYHLYVIRSEHREGLIAHLKKVGIGTGIHYPVPLHLQQAYLPLHYRRGDFPVTERVAADIVSLPMFPHLTAEQQKRVVAEISHFTSQVKRLPPKLDVDVAIPVAQTSLATAAQ